MLRGSCTLVSYSTLAPATNFAADPLCSAGGLESLGEFLSGLGRAAPSRSKALTPAQLPTAGPPLQ